MPITQLNPLIPVRVTSKDNRTGEAFALLDYGQEHHILWGVALDDTGEVWWAPNPEIRVLDNWSLDRMRHVHENKEKPSHNNSEMIEGYIYRMVHASASLGPATRTPELIWSDRILTESDAPTGIIHEFIGKVLMPKAKIA